MTTPHPRAPSRKSALLHVHSPAHNRHLQAAAKPYDGMSNDMVIVRVTAGFRLPRPADCPRYVYSMLMMQCWNADPALRPTFAGLRASPTLASQGAAGTKQALAHAASMHLDSHPGIGSAPNTFSSSFSSIGGPFPGDDSGGSACSGSKLSNDGHHCGRIDNLPIPSPRSRRSGSSLYLSLEGASGVIIEAGRDLPSPDRIAHVNRDGIISISDGDTEEYTLNGHMGHKGGETANRIVSMC